MIENKRYGCKCFNATTIDIPREMWRPLSLQLFDSLIFQSKAEDSKSIFLKGLEVFICQAKRKY